MRLGKDEVNKALAVSAMILSVALVGQSGYLPEKGETAVL